MTDIEPKTPQAESTEPKRARWLLRIGGVVVALPIVSWLAVQVFLWAAPSLLFSSEARTRVDWRVAWSGWPETIQLRDVTISGRSGIGAWSVELDEARLEHDLGALFDRTFHARVIAARGARFRWQRLESSAGAPPPRRLREPGSRPWTLVFDEIRIDELTTLDIEDRHVDAASRPGRVTGQATIETKGGPVTVPRAELDLREATLNKDGETEGMIQTLRLAGSIDTYDPREHRGIAVLPFVTAELDMRADRWGFDVVRHVLGDLPVDVRGDGALDATVAVERGRLRPGTRLRLEGDDLAVRYLDLVGTGEGRLDLDVTETDGAGVLEATLSLDDFVGGADGASPHLRSGPEGLRLELISPTLDLVAPEPEVRAELRLLGAEVPDFSAYRTLLPPTLPLRLLGGRGELDLRFVLDTARDDASGSIALRARDVAASWQDRRLSGDLKLDVQLVDGDIIGQRFDLVDTRLDLDGVVADGIGDREWWARVEIPEGEMVLGEPLDIEARLSAQLADSRPLVLLAPSLERVPFWQRLLGIRPIGVTGEIRLDPRRWVVRDATLRAGSSFRGTAQVELVDDAAHGVALLTLGPVHVGVELSNDGERDIKLRRARRWYGERESEWRVRLADQPGN
ncbi:MAG: hypothetical protein AAGE94_14905 [Acidobacteriota bacterium]